MGKYVDADKLYKSFGITGECDTCKEKYDCEMDKTQYDLSDICWHIEYAPEIHIVHCKSCKHLEDNGHCTVTDLWMDNPWWSIISSSEFFCGFGEPREVTE